MYKVIPVDIDIPVAEWMFHARLAEKAMQDGDLHGFQDAFKKFKAGAAAAAKKAADAVHRAAEYAAKQYQKHAPGGGPAPPPATAPPHAVPAPPPHGIPVTPQRHYDLHPDSRSFQQDLIRQLNQFREVYLTHSAEYEQLLKQLIQVQEKLFEMFYAKFGAHQAPEPGTQPESHGAPEYHPPTEPPNEYVPGEANPPPAQYEPNSYSDNPNNDGFEGSKINKVIRVCRGKNTYYCVRHVSAQARGK